MEVQERRAESFSDYVPQGARIIAECSNCGPLNPPWASVSPNMEHGWVMGVVLVHEPGCTQTGEARVEVVS